MALKRRPAFGDRIFPFTMGLMLVALAGCAEVQVRTLPSPPPTPKIRVFVEAISEPGIWKMSVEEFSKRVPKFVGQVLVETGIYEVASIEDSKSVLVGSPPLTRWDWAKKDWELARKVGRGLHADYAVIVCRSRVRGHIFWEMTFLNVATGKKYRSVSRAPQKPYLDKEDYANIFKIKYREIFQEAKNDMLATAIQKSRVTPLISPVQLARDPAPAPPSPAPSPPRISARPAAEKPLATSPKEIKEAKGPSSPRITVPPVGEKPLAAPPKEIKEVKAPPPAPAVEKPKSRDHGKVPPPFPRSPEPSSPRISAPPAAEKILETTPAAAPSPPQISAPAVQEKPFPAVSKEKEEAPVDLAGVKVLDLDKILTAESKPDGRKRLAVYDLETIESLRVVALILSEALREELIRLGHFALVNRENLVQVLKEIELQMTGLVDEKQAVKIGKGLAANQIVMGRYGALGKTAVLQAKRVDVESQGTLAMASLKCSQGQEDELLAQMSDLARKLASGN